MPAESLQTLRRAIAVMDCFSAERAELGVREVARRADLSTSVTGRLLCALKEMGFLSQNPETRAYSMGARVLRWAEVYNSTLEIRNRALPAIQELHESTRETISLYILEGNERVCVERLESPQSVRIVARVGRRLPLYAGSAGKVMLAFMDPERMEAVLRSIDLIPLTERTITDPAVLRHELERIRRAGCATSVGEWVDDAAGVAAPILDQNSQVTAALAISGPASRFTDAVVARYCDQVKRIALEISEGMGYKAEASQQYR